MGALVVPTEVSEVRNIAPSLGGIPLTSSQLQLALQTAALEVKYAHSSRVVQDILRDEDIRQLKHKLLLLEDDRDELLEQLEKEDERADNFELDLNDTLARCDGLEAEVNRLNDELRVKVREGSVMKVS
jgi:hypothetical protein